MDFGDGYVRSRSEEEEMVEEGAHFNEDGCGMNGSSSAVSEIGDLGSVLESIEFEILEKSADVDENLGNNGSCDDAIGKIVTSVEMNGEIVGIEKAIATPSKGIGSPSEISKGLEDGGSQSKSKEVEKVENLEKLVQFDETKLDVNVPIVDEIGDLGRNQDLNGQGIEDEKTLETQSKAMGSPSGDSGVSPTAKGYGLKKWRRIRRDPVKDGTGVVDPNRILKRGLSNAEPEKTRNLSVENNQKSEGSGSVASVNSAVKNLVFSALPVGVSDSESRLAGGTAFAIGTDSENSEDRSSKSSTAASAPKSRLEVPIMVGFTKEINKGKNASGRSSGNAVHRAQQGKGKVEASKKHRGEKVKIEKENSYSSVESDLRSSNAVVMEVGAFSRVTNGRQRECSSNYEGENSDEVLLCELQSSEEVQADYYKENGEEVEVVSREGVVGGVSEVDKNEVCENQGPHTDQDPLAESVNLLQAAQEALEREILKFGEIGKETVSLPDSSSCGVSSSAEEREESNSAPKESQLAELRQKVSLLEHELEVATTTLKAKESMVFELESILNTTLLLKEGSKDNLAFLQEMAKEMEIELEGLFRNKIEAEVEYLMMVRHTLKLKLLTEDRVSLLEPQQYLAEKQGQMVMELRDAEDKATLLKRQAEELEASNRELLGTKDVLKMQNDVCKSTLCCFTQLILLCIAFAFFLLQLLPHSHGVVPT